MRILAIAIVGVALTAGTALAAAGPQNEEQSELRSQAKITMQQAEHTALSKEQGTIKSKELEKENGRIIYSFDVQTANGIREVNVDAISGKIVEDSSESPGAEAAERKQERKEQKTKNNPGGPIATAVPISVANTGEYAENIYDAAQSSNWTDATHKLASLRQAVNNFPQGVPSQQKQAIQSGIQKLEQSIPAHDRIGVLKEANRVTRLAAEASAHYRPNPPVEVSLLDYYGRELQIGAETNDSASLHRTASQMQQTWNKIKPKVEQRSPSEASRFGQLISKIDSAQSTSQYAQLANTELDQVDRLEKVFEAPAVTAQR